MDVLAMPTTLPRPRAVARIVALTDFTPASNAGLRCAARLAGLHRARILRMLHVVGPGDLRPDEITVNDVSARLLAVQRSFERVPVTPTVEMRDDTSLVDATLAEIEATAADLLVVTLPDRGWLDDTMTELVRRVPVNMLCVRRDAVVRWPEQPARVLVGVDFSDASRRALVLANRLADGPVLAVHVVEHRAESGPDGSAVASPFARDPFLPGRLRDRVASWAGDLADEVHIAQGEVSDRLLSIACDEAAGLIVLGKDGIRDRGGLARGRAPERVLAETTVPVLLVG